MNSLVRIFTFQLLLLLIPAYLSASGKIRFQKNVLDVGTSTYGAMVIDNQGFLWLGTVGRGVVRYDGVELREYGVGENGLTGSMVSSIVVDGEDTIWIGTFNNGLTAFDKRTNTFHHYKHDPASENSISSNNIPFTPQSLYVDRSGAVWVGSEGEGVNRYQRQDGLWQNFRHNPHDENSLSNNTVQAILEDSNGYFWFGTRSGLSRYEPSVDRWTTYSHDPLDESSLSDNWINALYEDRQGRLFVGTNGAGLSVLDPATGEVERFLHDPNDPASLGDNSVWNLYGDSGGRIWIGHYASKGSALDIFDPRTMTFTRYNSGTGNWAETSSGNVVEVVEDVQTGRTWVYNSTGVVDAYDPSAPRVAVWQYLPDDENSLSDSLVIPVLAGSGGGVWVGTGSKGLNRIDPTTGKVTRYPFDPNDVTSIPNPYITALYEGPPGKLWVGCGDGSLNLFDRDTKKVITSYTHSPKDPDSISENSQVKYIVGDLDNPGILWVATIGGGLNRFDTETGRFERFSSSDDGSGLAYDSIVSLFDDGQGRLWLATYGGGLDILDKASMSFQNYRHDPADPDSIPSDSLYEIFKDSKGRIWIGSKGGLSLFEPDGEIFINYSKVDGLPSNTIDSILEDGEGNLWLATIDAGVVRFNPELRDVRVFRENDGLPSRAIFWTSRTQTDDGAMWFGSKQGVFTFLPEQMASNTSIPPIVLTSFLQGGQTPELGSAPELVEEVILQWDENFFEFKFAALNFLNPGENLYAYKLEGRDKEWFYSGNTPSGRYTGLDGGHYTLRIKGSNNHGVWNEEGKSILINVIPPFWQRDIFYLAIAGLISSVVLFVMFYLRKLNFEIAERRQKEKELQESEEEFRVLFQNNPVSCWLEDFSSVKEYFDQLRRGGVDDIKRYFDDHPQAVGRCAELIVIQDVNQATLDLHGAESKSELFAGLHKLITDESLAVFRMEMEDVWSGKNEATYDGVTLTLDGEERFVTMNYKVVPGYEESLAKVLVTLVDNTARTLAEHEQRKLETQLQRSQRMESIGTLAGGIAHDFNNILSAIIGYADIALLDLPEDSNARRHIGEVLKAGTRAKDLVKHILTFSRISPENMVPMKIDLVATEVLELLRASIPTTIEIDAAIDPDCGNILGSQTKVHQVVMNLCTNAYQAMEPGGGKLTVRLDSQLLDGTEITEPPLPPGEYVRLQVTDTGVGMSREVQERIFEPYFTTKAVGKGSGMGLSVVVGIVKAHKAGTRLHSEEGEGTSFEVFFPSIGVEVGSDSWEGRVVPTGSESILVVDDEIAIANLLKIRLEKLGYEVRAVNSSLEALELFRRSTREFDLLITDHTMPGMTGEQLVKEIRTLNPGLPVIICTGFSNNFDSEKAEAAGIDNFMMKPVQHWELAESIRKVLDRTA